MKKIFLTFSFIFFIILWISFSYSKEDSASLSENIFQEEINKNFKPIDEKMFRFLVNLEKQKNYCFWKEKQKNYTDCIDYIDKIFSINSEEFVMWENWYARACEKALKDTINKQETKSIPSKNARDILDISGKWKTCTELYLTKLSIYKSIAYDILEENKGAILKDNYKKYTQENRKRYDELLEIARVNLWYIERLWKKWPSKTKK